MRCFNPDLFLARLPIETTMTDVRKLLEGIHIEMDFCDVVRNRSMGRGPMETAIAFVRLKDKTKAEAAIEKLNGFVLDENHTLSVRKYAPKPRASYRSPEHPTWSKHLAGETATEAAQ